MKLVILMLFISVFSFGQPLSQYAASAENPFGKLNPEAPKEIADYAPMIGTCDCVSTARKADQTWAEPQKMTWTFKYIMNGTAIQDETLKEDGSHSGSIRQFIADSSKWYVHWYSNTTPSTTLPTWHGKKQGDSIVLYREQKAPNGTDGYFRLSFKNISEDGFSWIGEWVNKPETFVFPTWTIECKKRKEDSDEDIILKNTISFSQAYMRGDAKAVSNFYTQDGKIFPSNSDIISGHTALEKHWTLPEGVKVLHHKVTPSEIKIIDNYAYDFGYYEGKSLSKENKEQPFKGKYVIVWKKVGDDWKIYLDIWNRI